MAIQLPPSPSAPAPQSTPPQKQQARKDRLKAFFAAESVLSTGTGTGTGTENTLKPLTHERDEVGEATTAEPGLSDLNSQNDEITTTANDSNNGSSSGGSNSNGKAITKFTQNKHEAQFKEALGQTQTQEQRSGPGAEAEGKPALTTDQLWPITGLWHGLIAFKGQKYTALVRVSGFNARLMSAAERNGYVRRISAHFNSVTNPFAFYCIAKPKSMRSYIARLDRKRVALPASEKDLREQSWIVRDEIEKKERDRAITERVYWASMEANATDLKSLSKSKDAQENEDGSKVSLWLKAWQQFLFYALGRDPQAQSSGKGKGEAGGGTGKRKIKFNSTTRATDKKGDLNPNVPAGLLDTLGFKTQGFGETLTLNGMKSQMSYDLENLIMLVEQLDAVLTPQEIARLLQHQKAGGGPSTPLPAGIDPLNLLGRANFEEYADCLKVGRDWVTSLVVTEYPRNFKFAQLFQLIRFRDIRMSVALHCRPLSVKEAENKLRNKQSILVAGEGENKSQTRNVDTLYKIESIRQLRAVLASGDARIFQVMIIISVRSELKETMKDDLQRVSQRLIDMNFEVAYPTRNQRRAFLSSIPLGHNFLAGDKLLADRISHPNMTGEGITCLLPNCVADFIQAGGIPLGRNKNDGSLVAYNRWIKTSANPHSVLIATTGGGKTVTQMLELLLEFLKNPDMEGYIFDIQNVFGRYARQVNGRVVDLSLAAQECVNPMDRFVSLGRPETVGERLNFLYALFALMIKRDLQGPETNIVGRAAKRLYRHFESGESADSIVYAQFANNPFYAALRPYLLDYREPVQGQGSESGPLQPGIMTRLKVIWAYLTGKHRVPTSGLIEGHTDRHTGEFLRPICQLYDNKWWYCGEGETSEPYVEPAEIAAIPPGKSRPAGVYYPHPEWWQALMDEYRDLVEAEGIFDMLDDTALDPAIRDAALELKRGQPILGDLIPYLVAEGALPLADSLEGYCDDERFGPIFNQYSTIDLDSRFIAWNLKDLDDNLRPIRMFQIVNLVWARVRAYRKRRMLIMDEFQTMVQNFRDVGTFTRDMFQRGRYFRLAMTAIVQNAAALLTYPEANLCVQNADRKILLKQDEAAIRDLLTLYPNLTDGATDILQGATQGEGLIKVGNADWTHVQYELSDYHLESWNTNTDQEGEDEFVEDQEAHDLWRYVFEPALEADRKAAQAQAEVLATLNARARARAGAEVGSGATK